MTNTFVHRIMPGNLKKTMRSAEAGSRDLWQVDPRKLKTMPGFNVRVRDDAYRDHINAIADSILENGFFQHEPLGGIVDGDAVTIHAGHCRLEGVLLAIEKGAPIERVPVVMSPAGTSIEDLTVEMARAVTGKPLSTYESAIACARLSRYGWDSAKIAKRLGYASAQYVDSLLTLAAAPPEVRILVENGTVSATTAVAAMKEHGVKAQEVIANAKKKAPGKKVTARAILENKITLKQAMDLLRSVWHDPGYSGLSEVLVDRIDKALGEVKK